MSHRMSDRMSEEMSDRMPDRMSDRMLESPPMVIRLVALAIKIVHAAIPTVTAGQLWLSRSSWDVVERWACGTSLDRSDAFRTYLHRSPGQREANHFLCCVASLLNHSIPCSASFVRWRICMIIEYICQSQNICLEMPWWGSLEAKHLSMGYHGF
jgi:hypothetical protein